MQSASSRQLQKSFRDKVLEKFLKRLPLFVPLIEQALTHGSTVISRRGDRSFTSMEQNESNKKAYGRKKVLRFYDVRPDAKKEGAKAVCN